MTTLGTYLTSSAASSTYQTIANMSNYLTTTTAASIYQTVANMSSYLTTSTASTTYQTVLSVASATSGLFRLLTTRPGNSTQYIGSLNFPSGSLFGAIISASTPDIISLDDSNFYTTFYTQSQSDTKYATKASPTFTGTLAAPTINASSTLQVGGTNISSLYQSKPYLAGKVSGTTVKASTGTQSFTVSNPSTGNYTITWTNGHPNGVNYGVIASGNLTSVVYTNITSTSFQVQPFNPVTGYGTNSDFTFMTIP